jgi:diguanylate cyclase (GGDEF)-like protein/hemerythrin-like metal-binding protein
MSGGIIMLKNQKTVIAIETAIILITLVTIQYFSASFAGPLERYLLSAGAILVAIAYYILRVRYHDLKQVSDSNLDAAITDKLTGLYNRNYLDEAIKKEFALADRTQRPVSLIYFDIDKFKHINDTYGHEVGDIILKTVADIVVSNTRVSDIVCRWGGDEYIVLLPETKLKDVEFVAEKIRVGIEDFSFANDISITVSLGVAQRVVGEYYSSLFRRADKALYMSKENGRNLVSVSKYNHDEVDLKYAWLDSWNCGVEAIDIQHRQLIELTNKLSEQFSIENKVTDEILKISSALVEDIRNHFTYEIIALRESNYPDVDKHEIIHKKLIDQIEIKRIEFEKGEVAIRSYLNFIFNELVVNHLLYEDSKYFKYVQ